MIEFDRCKGCGEILGHIGNETTLTEFCYGCKIKFLETEIRESDKKSEDIERGLLDAKRGMKNVIEHLADLGYGKDYIEMSVWHTMPWLSWDEFYAWFDDIMKS
jgi:hypothetical protein